MKIYRLSKMELINNVSKTLRDDLAAHIRSGSRLSIAASCFSIYAFQELKEALKDIRELHSIIPKQIVFALQYGDDSGTKKQLGE